MTWSEPTVLGLMRKHHGRDPEAVIEAYIADKLSAGRQRSLPIDVDGLASFLGIKQRIERFPFAGRIYAESSGQLVMDLNLEDREPRRRFTCAHEIIHTAFPGFKRQERYRSDLSTGRYTQRDEEEYLCDKGAASLLMPTALVRDCHDLDDGLDAIEALAGDGDVSLEAAGNRLVSLANRPAMMLVLELAHKPADRVALRRGEPIEQRLRVRYGIASGMRVFAPKHKSVADDSLFMRALETSQRQRGRTYLPGAERHGLFDIECASYPYGDRSRVIALIR
ncbi:MAG: ImmA/IrrE family metallo-endopeptidase [Acidimicrobiia bacterium]